MREAPPFKKTTLSGAFEDELGDVAHTKMDPEVQAYDLIKKIATLYCTKPGECWPTTPKTYLSNDGKWGPYYICLLPYAAEDLAVQTTNDGETVTMYDRSVRKRLEVMAEHLRSVAEGHVFITQPDDTLVLTFPSIDGLLESCSALLKNQICPGGDYEKAKLSSTLPLIRGLVAAEREGVSQSVTYLNIEASFPDDQEKPDEPGDAGDRERPYHPFLTSAVDAFCKIVAHCGDRDEFDAEDLLVSAALQDDGLLFIIRKFDDEGERRLSGGLHSFIRDTFEMLDELPELAHVKFVNLNDAFAIKMPDAEDAITMLRALLENLEEERMCCVDDLEGITVYAAPTQLDEANRFAASDELAPLEFLPNSLQATFENAALLELECYDQGVMPFSLKELEYLLWQADAHGKDSYIPTDYRAFVRH